MSTSLHAGPYNEAVRKMKHVVWFGCVWFDVSGEDAHEKKKK